MAPELGPVEQIVDLDHMCYTMHHPWAAEALRPGPDGVPTIPANSLHLHIHLPMVSSVQVGASPPASPPHDPSHLHTMCKCGVHVCAALCGRVCTMQEESGYSAALGVLLASLLTGVPLPYRGFD